MSERLPWFRCFPSALLGALAGMQPDEGFVYAVALLRIYETGGPVAETARTLARRTGMTERRAAIALDDLIASGKLSRLDDGRIDAESTHDEIAWQREMRQANSVAGKTSAEKRAGKTQRNQRNVATRVERASNDKREESKNSSDASASVAVDAATPALSPSDVIWQKFPRLFADLAGKSEASVRTWIGKVLKQHPPEAALAAFEAAAMARTGDPFGYATRALQSRPPPQSDGRRRPPSNEEIWTNVALDAHDELTRRNNDGNDPFDGKIIQLSAIAGEQGSRHADAARGQCAGSDRSPHPADPGILRAFG